MLDELHESFTVEGRGPPVEASALGEFKGRFPAVPSDYLSLVQESSTVELSHNLG